MNSQQGLQPAGELALKGIAAPGAVSGVSAAPSRLQVATALVNKVDLSAVVDRLMNAPDGPKWSVETVQRAERRYRRFLIMTVLFPKAPLTPARDIDTVWHEHILNTRAYWRDCEMLFGEYLHHDAGYGAKEVDFENKAILDRQSASVYASLFGEQYFKSGQIDQAHCTISACVESRIDPSSVMKADAAHCTISACVESRIQPSSMNADAAHCTISACVESRITPDRLAEADAAHCTISACVESRIEPSQVQAAGDLADAAHCTISACVESRIDPSEVIALGALEDAAHCTISACVESRIDPAQLQAATEAAHCTISACVESRTGRLSVPSDMEAAASGSH